MAGAAFGAVGVSLLVMLQCHCWWQAQHLVMSGASLFVVGAAFGFVAVSLFVAGAAFGDVAVSLFVAGAASGEIWVDSRSARLRDVVIFNRKGVSEARKVTCGERAGAR